MGGTLERGHIQPSDGRVTDLKFRTPLSLKSRRGFVPDLPLDRSETAATKVHTHRRVAHARSVDVGTNAVTFLGSSSCGPHVSNEGLCRPDGRNSGLHVVSIRRQTQAYPAALSGTDRIRTPVAAKMALPIAGMAGGKAGSPSPVGSKSVWRNFTSIADGTCAMRVG